jgi:putative N-acetylmannosamine-6-phosphate epimerase
MTQFNSNGGTAMTEIIERDVTIIAADGSTEKRAITVDAATWETIEHIQDGGTLTLAVMNELHQALPTQTVNGFIAHSMHAHEEDRLAHDGGSDDE